MNFSVFWIFVMGQLVLQGENHFFSFFRVFRTTTVGLLFIVVYLLNHLPGKSFLFLGGKPSFFGFDVFTKAPAIQNPNVLSGVLFSELVKLFGLEKLISCGEKAVVGQNLPLSQGVVKYVENPAKACILSPGGVRRDFGRAFIGAVFQSANVHLCYSFIAGDLAPQLQPLCLFHVIPASKIAFIHDEKHMEVRVVSLLIGVVGDF